MRRVTDRAISQRVTRSHELREEQGGAEEEHRSTSGGGDDSSRGKQAEGREVITLGAPGANR